MSDTTTTTAQRTDVHIFMDMEQADRLIRALEASKRAARRDVERYGHEGVEARVMITATATADGVTRLDVQTMESWITSFRVDDMDVDI